MQKPKISVVLPFRNEIATLKECLDSFIIQKYKNMEIILVDSDSNDGSGELAKQYAKDYKFIKYYNSSYIPGTWATSFYIKAINYSTGEIIYMADGNVKIAPNYFSHTIKHFENKNVAGVVGKVLMWDTKSAISKYRSLIWALRYNNLKRIKNQINEGLILPRVFSRKAFDDVGGFNPKAGWAVDIFLSKAFLKQGYKIEYDPKTIWWHKWRDNARELIKYNLKFGRLNVDVDFKRIKQWIKNIYFLLPFLFLILSIFNYKYLFLILLHPLPIILDALIVYIKSNGLKYQVYSFVGIYLSYLQNIPYAIGFFIGLSKFIKNRLIVFIRKVFN